MENHLHHVSHRHTRFAETWRLAGKAVASCMPMEIRSAPCRIESLAKRPIKKRQQPFLATRDCARHLQRLVEVKPIVGAPGKNEHVGDVVILFGPRTHL